MSGDIVTIGPLKAFRFAALCNGGRQQYLIFEIGDLALGIPFHRVAEVRTLLNLSPVFLPPNYAAGFAMIHGVRVDLLDLRTEFGAPATLDDYTRLIVGWRQTPEGVRKVGLLVDRVKDVSTIEGADLIHPSILGEGSDTGFIMAAHVEGGRRRLLLDLDELVG